MSNATAYTWFKVSSAHPYFAGKDFAPVAFARVYGCFAVLNARGELTYPSVDVFAADQIQGDDFLPQDEARALEHRMLARCPFLRVIAPIWALRDEERAAA